MKALKFPEVNVMLAKDQPEYETLPVHVDITDKTVPATMCFELSEEEKNQVAETGQLWFTQLTFGGHFQPIRMSILKPELVPVEIPYAKKEGGS
ncbi:hypothetical protein [Mariniphaga sediminis]|uniref:hypothetical protein n=1 Tax=Mariniphaga sediminis TaxID=1628158 RepID=UPI00356261B2